MDRHEIHIARARLHVLEAGIQSLADSTARPPRPGMDKLAHLDMPTPCSAGEDADIIDEPENCRETAEWNVRVHYCTEGNPDGFRAAFFCSHHLAVILLTLDILRAQTDGQMPCGTYASSVYDLVRFELC